LGYGPDYANRHPPGVPRPRGGDGAAGGA